MSLPIVSIGICVKNAEATIKEAIESVLKQDYPHKFLELIIVDGYSKDNTVSIIEKILSNSDLNYKIFYENEGLGNARQIVLENSSGKYILWVDGDIILSHNYLRKHVNFMEKNPNVGVAAGKFSFIKETETISKLENIDWVVGDYRKRQAFTADPIRICCAGSIFRVNSLKQAGGFDKRIKGACEDIDLAYRIQEAGWRIHFGVNAELQHVGKKKLKSLWKENFWYGYGGHYVIHKHSAKIHSSLIEAFQRVSLAYKLTRCKIIFLLPILYLFKKIAWLYGFTKAHIDSYGHI
jgi:glycosyltransferase involved in cell wall biosynthesis